jgi:hypothetical protein
MKADSCEAGQALLELESTTPVKAWVSIKNPKPRSGLHHTPFMPANKNPVLGAPIDLADQGCQLQTL